MRREDGQGRKKVLQESYSAYQRPPTPSLKSDAQERVFELGGEESDDQLEQEPDASVVDEVHQPSSPVPVREVRQVIPDDMLQPYALPPPIGWDE